MSDEPWRSEEGTIDVLTRHGVREVLVQEAELEVAHANSFLETVDNNDVPAEMYAAGRGYGDAVVRDVLTKWKAANADAIAMIRFEATSFERLRRKLKPGELWYFIERSHALRQSLVDSLAKL